MGGLRITYIKFQKFYKAMKDNISGLLPSTRDMKMGLAYVSFPYVKHIIMVVRKHNIGTSKSWKVQITYLELSYISKATNI